MIRVESLIVALLWLRQLPWGRPKIPFILVRWSAWWCFRILILFIRIRRLDTIVVLVLLLSLELTSRRESSLTIWTISRLKLFISLVPSSSKLVRYHPSESTITEARILFGWCLLFAFRLLSNLVEKEILHLKEPVSLFFASDQMRHPFQDVEILPLTTAFTSQWEVSELEPREKLLLTVDPPLVTHAWGTLDVWYTSIIYSDLLANEASHLL